MCLGRWRDVTLRAQRDRGRGNGQAVILVRAPEPCVLEESGSDTCVVFRHSSNRFGGLSHPAQPLDGEAGQAKSDDRIVAQRPLDSSNSTSRSMDPILVTKEICMSDGISIYDPVRVADWVLTFRPVDSPPHPDQTWRGFGSFLRDLCAVPS